MVPHVLPSPYTSKSSIGVGFILVKSFRKKIPSNFCSCFWRLVIFLISYQAKFNPASHSKAPI